MRFEWERQLFFAILVGVLGFFVVNAGISLYESVTRYEEIVASVEFDKRMYSLNDATAHTIIACRDSLAVEINAERVLLAGDMQRFNSLTAENATAEKAWREAQKPSLIDKAKEFVTRYL